MIIWADIRVPIIHKCWHIHSRGGTLHRDFTKDFGDVPVGRFNTITNKWEDVDNNRGRAYAARNRVGYRKGGKTFNSRKNLK